MTRHDDSIFWVCAPVWLFTNSSAWLIVSCWYPWSFKSIYSFQQSLWIIVPIATCFLIKSVKMQLSFIIGTNFKPIIFSMPSLDHPKDPGSFNYTTTLILSSTSTTIPSPRIFPSWSNSRSRLSKLLDKMRNDRQQFRKIDFVLQLYCFLVKFARK